jgi:hypothetical protein
VDCILWGSSRILRLGIGGRVRLERSEGLVAVEHGDPPLPVIVSLAVHPNVGERRWVGVSGIYVALSRRAARLRRQAF